VKKYFFLPLVFISFVVLFLQMPSVLNQKILADNPVPGGPGGGQTGPKHSQCTCDTAGKVGNGNNGFKCDDGSHHWCAHQEQACVSSPNNIALNTGTVDYIGVSCNSTAVTCTCSADKKQVVCTNSVTHQIQKDDCGTAKVCLTGAVQVHDAFNQLVHGADCQQNCKCDHPGKTGNGMNGWTCADKSKSSACSNREDYCKQNANSPGGVECVNSSKCTCSSDKTQINCVSKGSGPGGADEKQTFDCNGPSCISGSNVDQPDFRFANQHITGIKCNNPTGPTQLPPPPSPPCKQWSGNGVCQTFGSAFGGFSTDPEGFIQKIFAILLSVSGGIALLLIIKAGYQLMTAQGNPEKLNNAREQLVAAIVGLVFLIFSFVFLQLIGFDILKVPGFKGGQSTANNTAICNPGSCIQTSLCTAKNPGRCNSNGCPGGQSCVQ
jgi:hypothetical protein